MAGRAVNRQQAAAVNDVSQAADVVLPRLIGGALVGAVAAAPILTQEGALGAIEVYSPRPRHWRSDELELLSAFAAAAAVAISNARLHQREQQAIQTRDDFLAAASHDLKNPLTAIRGATQVLERSLARAGSVPPERLAASLRTIGNAAARMTSQIDELLDVARLRLGEPLSLERSRIDLVILARQLAATYDASSERHSIEVQTTVPELTGVWDARRIARVIENLLLNAIKYSPNGGTITLRIGREDDTAVLAVRDRGLGIPSEDLPHVFERFRRAANVLGRIEGTGIGLAAAAQIVEQHGGSIDLQSREGEGTVVTLRLPLDDASSSD
jgi:signal transduction histidine kinase